MNDFLGEDMREGGREWALYKQLLSHFGHITDGRIKLFVEVASRQKKDKTYDNLYSYINYSYLLLLISYSTAVCNSIFLKCQTLII